MMTCQWCATREAKWWGQPWSGPQSRMCDPCRDRVCRRDVQAGKVVFVCEPYEGQERAAAGARGHGAAGSTAL